MTGEELRKQAFEHIQTHPYIWRKWCEAREEWQRQELMTSVVALLVSEYCIEVMRANQSNISFAFDVIRREYEEI